MAWYEICQRSGGLGPKRQMGDYQVPEGFYTIKAYNPASSYHLAILVSYPNLSDRLRKKGKNPGDNICIHGNCVTIGCIPLTNRWIEELYLICLDTVTKTESCVKAAGLSPCPCGSVPLPLESCGSVPLPLDIRNMRDGDEFNIISQKYSTHV